MFDFDPAVLTARDDGMDAAAGSWRGSSLVERLTPPRLCSCKGTVPVLMLVDRTVIDESIDIMRWALAQDDPEQ